MQMMKKLGVENILFLNFESPQLYEFSLTDFARLDSIVQKSGVKTLFFDELQLVDSWEMYVREKLDERARHSIDRASHNTRAISILLHRVSKI